VTDILAGNTDPKQNPIWAKVLEIRNGPKGRHRPIAVKTGTANDARDLATYGYLAPPADPTAPGLVVGIWMGNSDHSMPASKKPATSLTAAAPLWQAFVRDVTAGMPIADFPRPAGVVSASIDAWSGGARGGWTRDVIKEWFIDGTQPGSRRAVDPPGLLYSRACGGWRVDPLKAELGPKAWDADVANWVSRARRGSGVGGQHDSRTAYFWGERSWGGTLIGGCSRPKPDEPREKPKKDQPPNDKPPKPDPPAPPAP
jgi:membrane peptidoglycan carboxypeptidase